MNEVKDHNQEYLYLKETGIDVQAEKFEVIQKKFLNVQKEMEKNLSKVHITLTKLDNILSKRINSKSLKNTTLLKPVHIFIIDEDKDELLLFETALKELEIEHTITHATNGNDSLQLLAKQNPHFLYINPILPGMSGLETLHLIRQSYSNLSCTIFLYSTILIPQYIHEAAALNAICLTKPSNLNDLKNILTLTCRRF